MSLAVDFPQVPLVASSSLQYYIIVCMIDAVDDQDIMDTPHYEVIENLCRGESFPDSAPIAPPASGCYDIIVQNPNPACEDTLI